MRKRKRGASVLVCGSFVNRRHLFVVPCCPCCRFYLTRRYRDAEERTGGARLVAPLPTILHSSFFHFLLALCPVFGYCLPRSAAEAMPNASFPRRGGIAFLAVSYCFWVVSGKSVGNLKPIQRRKEETLPCHVQSRLLRLCLWRFILRTLPDTSEEVSFPPLPSV